MGLPPLLPRIYIVNVSNRAITPLLAPIHEADIQIQPSWSPDGREVAFMHVISGAFSDTEIYVVNADGSSPRNLTNNSVDDGSPEWSPDGSAITFVSRRDGNNEVYLMYPDRSRQFNLTKNQASDGSPSWQSFQSGAPRLLAEEGTERAVALDSVTLTRDTFSVETSHNFSSDKRTRVMLFARNVKLLPGEDASAVTAQAVDDQQRVHLLVVEHVGKVPGSSWLRQVTVKLPIELIGTGDVRVSISLHGSLSNQVFFRVAGRGSSQ